VERSGVPCPNIFCPLRSSRISGIPPSGEKIPRPASFAFLFPRLFPQALLVGGTLQLLLAFPDCKSSFCEAPHFTKKIPSSFPSGCSRAPSSVPPGSDTIPIFPRLPFFLLSLSRFFFSTFFKFVTCASSAFPPFKF